jgi:hypothetical protein
MIKGDYIILLCGLILFFSINFVSSQSMPASPCNYVYDGQWTCTHENLDATSLVYYDWQCTVNPNMPDQGSWAPRGTYPDMDSDGKYSNAQLNHCSLTFDCDDNNITKWQYLYGYWDYDGDGYGVGSLEPACSGTSLARGYASVSGDCNDNDITKWQYLYWFKDSDGDGYYDETQTEVCSGTSPPAGYSDVIGNDCEPLDASINPGAMGESGSKCSDGKDNECDDNIDCADSGCYSGYYYAPGAICEGGGFCCNFVCEPIDLIKNVYYDFDGDGFGDSSVSALTCPAPNSRPNYVSFSGDCKTYDASVYPSALEICSDGVDNNCNGLGDCYDPSCVSYPGCPATYASCTSPPCMLIPTSPSYYLVSDSPNFEEGIVYGIKPSGINFPSGINISLNYNPSLFSSPSIYRYLDIAFENQRYNITELNVTNKIIGSEGGFIQLRDIKFEMQAGDLNQSYNFVLRKANISQISNYTLPFNETNNSIILNGTSNALENVSMEFLTSSIRSWVEEESNSSINVIKIVAIIKALIKIS